MFDVACGGAEVLRVIKFLWKLLDIVLFLVPMGLIVFISLDFGKSVIASKDDSMKKNLGTVIKRIIYCIVLMLVPVICEFFIKIVSNETGKEGKNKGAFQCISIAITEDDFSEYEVDLPKD